MPDEFRHLSGFESSLWHNVVRYCLNRPVLLQAIDGRQFAVVAIELTEDKIDLSPWESSPVESPSVRERRRSGGPAIPTGVRGL